MIKKLETVLKLEQVVTTDEEGAGDSWETKKRAVYLGTLTNGGHALQVKLQFDTKDPEALKKILNPILKQQFAITLRDVSPKDTKLEEFHRIGKEMEDLGKEIEDTKEPGDEEDKEPGSTD